MGRTCSRTTNVASFPDSPHVAYIIVTFNFARAKRTRYFLHVRVQRLSSGWFNPTEPLQTTVLHSFHMSSGWFNPTEPLQTTVLHSFHMSSGWFNPTEPLQTTVLHSLHMSSGWFNPTNPVQTTVLQRKN